ncbi:PIN domain-containing protein [Candidatus Parcubacteria bacterium]|nr:PIN domain-containing protein [Candidatus Parcubacteria bacterium]
MSVPELLILDANILFSFFKSDSSRRYLVEELLNRECKLISPDFVFEELSQNKDKIMKFSKINESEFIFLFLLLKKEIETVSESEYSEFLIKSKEISPHTKDNPYFALALSVNFPIWSDEEEFKQQSKIEIFDTAKLAKLFGL